MASNDTQVMSGASAILAFLGGETFRMATGAYNLTALGNYLQFSLSQPANRIKHVRIHWQWWNNCYGMRWYRAHGAFVREPHRISENIPADQLREEFARVTGLACAS
jgi:hypothetical protein